MVRTLRNTGPKTLLTLLGCDGQDSNNPYNDKHGGIARLNTTILSFEPTQVRYDWKQTCNPTSSNDGGDVDSDLQYSGGEDACESLQSGTGIFSAGDPAWEYNKTHGDTKYLYKIEWANGCNIMPGQVNGSMPNPANSSWTCPYIFGGAYTWCTNNGGAGGTETIGCLQYFFNKAKP